MVPELRFKGALLALGYDVYVLFKFLQNSMSKRCKNTYRSANSGKREKKEERSFIKCNVCFACCYTANTIV